jgi:hypothetical protein
MQLSETIISPEIYEKCIQFAKASVHSSADKYARRNQFDVEKIVKDIRNGKIAEEITRAACLAKLPNLSEPDYNIYDKKNKSWDPDLKDADSGIRIAVKSQDIDSDINFGRSWVFQFGNGGKYDCDSGIFGKEDNSNHYVSFVSLNTPKRKATIRAIVKVSWLHDNKLFKEMKKQNLRGNKLAVYYDDLEKFPNQLFQL